MKGMKKKSETIRESRPEDEDVNGVAGAEEEVVVDAEAGEEEEEEEEEGEEVEGGGGGGGGDGEGQRPKLDEGFYEIEDVRRKRVRKGQVQYLIKWRGWPETANTWEPLENLKNCCDVIEAFQESLRSGKHRSSRKRKRKFGGPHTQPKKKQQQQQHSTSDLKGVKVRATVEPLLSTPLNNSSIADPPPPPSQDRVHTGKSAEGEGCGDEKEKHGNANNVETAEQTTENGYAYISLQDEQKKESEVDPKLSELKGTISIEEVDAGKFSIHFPYTRTSELDVPTDELSKGELAEPVQSNRFTGAKKRKSGFVRRFKQDSAPCEPAEALNAIGRSTIESYDKVEPLGSEDADSMGDYATDKNKLDDSINPFSIMKIIKPIGYMASLSNDVQDVSVTFVAMRSDGKEVVVDNNFLKANNPLLLISFYEQHLRYSPPT